MSKVIYDSRGQRLPLGSSLGKGGEGSVFDVCDNRGLVAKVYHKPVSREGVVKLTNMVRLRTDRLLSLAAWPVDLVYEKPGVVIGLLMPKATGKAIHTLYGPKSRLAEFPTADWRFLIHTAGNIARAFGVIHEHGHVIGDVNHGNLLVSDRATVRLIDCDSFQIKADGNHFLCEVGIETHTPPELQGKRFRDFTRTANHDHFGLAVLIFQLLFMGRHPFSGTHLGAGEMPISKRLPNFALPTESTPRDVR